MREGKKIVARAIRSTTSRTPLTVTAKSKRGSLAEEAEKRRRRSGARASGRVAAGIGSSLEIAVGWLPHRLGQFIRGFLGGRSGERPTTSAGRRGRSSRSFSLRTERERSSRTRKPIVSFYVLRLTIEGGERKRESRGSLVAGGQCTFSLLFLPRAPSSSSDRVSSSGCCLPFYSVPLVSAQLVVLFSRECVVQVSNAR